MTPWLWILVVFATAGLLAAIAGTVMALTGIVRVKRRVDALRQSSLVTKLESLQIQAARLTHLSGAAEDLKRRAEAAVDSLRKTPDSAGAPEIRKAWLECAAQFRTIVQELS